MSHLHRVALFVTLTALGFAAVGISSALRADDAPIRPDVPADHASWTLVKADWCNEVCASQCETCETAFTQGCTCYWLCENGKDGSQQCTGAIGVRICG